ncbi:MAG: hypothetical protein J6Q82_08005 [Clostridia bacterium]|nr:hypothetical protein [Clostridia bacterium]
MESQNYEKLLSQKPCGRTLLPRLCLILGYLAFFSVWFVAFLRANFAPALLVLAIALTVLLVLVTWKYVQVEYEYAIYSGSFFVAKIYGKTKRKDLVELDLKQAILIAPRTEEYLAQADRMKLDGVLWAVSSPKAENIWMIVYPHGEKNASLLFFEADEDAIRLMRRENPRATAKTK